MKILFVTGSRGEWGYIRPIIKLCIKKSIEYKICATNMVLLPSFGSLIDELKNDGYNVTDEIFMSLDGYDHFTMTKSLGIFLTSFVDVLKREKPNWLLLAGDRGEQLMASVAGSYTYTPVAHIQAGERSGNIDGLARHAIGKFSHIHFAANDDAKKRLLAMGEEKFRIFNVGAPQIDEIKNKEVSKTEEIKKKYNVNLKKKFILVILHPVTEEFDNISEQTDELFNALNSFNYNFVWVCPNNDAGSFIIKKKILNNRTSNNIIFENLTRKDFLFFLKNCECIVGNSSSGLLEAPSFKKPSVNIGRRQHMRIRGANVIDCVFKKKQITNAINKALSDVFKKKISQIKNPYGDGNSSKKILKILKETKINNELLTKNITI